MDIINGTQVYRERFTKDDSGECCGINNGDYWLGRLCYTPRSFNLVVKEIKERFPSAKVEYTPWSTKDQIFIMLSFVDEADEAEFIMCQENLSVDITENI